MQLAQPEQPVLLEQLEQLEIKVLLEAMVRLAFRDQQVQTGRLAVLE